jgi:cytochrome c
MKISTIAAVAAAFLASTAFAFAAGETTKDDAVVMVKKAVALIKADGPEKAYATISAGGEFVTGGTYAVVQAFDGMTLAHATDMTALAQKQASFWYDYKFVNPVTEKIQVKDNYCEVLDATRICAGVYRP